MEKSVQQMLPLEDIDPNLKEILEIINYMKNTKPVTINGKRVKKSIFRGGVR